MTAYCWIRSHLETEFKFDQSSNSSAMSRGYDFSCHLNRENWTQKEICAVKSTSGIDLYINTKWHEIFSHFLIEENIEAFTLIEENMNVFNCGVKITLNIFLLTPTAMFEVNWAIKFYGMESCAQKIAQKSLVHASWTCLNLENLHMMHWFFFQGEPIFIVQFHSIKVWVQKNDWKSQKLINWVVLNHFQSLYLIINEYHAKTVIFEPKIV